MVEEYEVTPNRLSALGRRHFLMATALAAGSTLMPFRSLAVTRQQVGDGELIVISDGALSLPMNFLYPDVPKEELEAFLKANDLPTDALQPPCNVTLLRQGDRLAIFDVGSGANFMPTAGKLLENLAAADIDPAEVTDVLFTHAHPDHLWGVTDDFEELVFPEARYQIGEAEWAYWSSKDTLDSVPADRQTFVVGAQNRFAAIEDKVEMIKPGQEVLAGVEAIDTSGHTPGHLSFLVHGNGAGTLIGGDALSHATISFQHPEWRTGSDQDPDKGVETRRRLLDRLVADKLHLIGYHFDHSGAGTVEAKDGAYSFVPLA
nr:MBL fold metallo-hydrolase [Rhizobium sp. TCK]